MGFCKTVTIARRAQISVTLCNWNANAKLALQDEFELSLGGSRFGSGAFARDAAGPHLDAGGHGAKPEAIAV